MYGRVLYCSVLQVEEKRRRGERAMERERQREGERERKSMSV